MKLRKNLSNLEKMCTLCSKYVNTEKDNYIATYNRRQYKLAHKSCYDNYLKFVKESWKNYER